MSIAVSDIERVLLENEHLLRVERDGPWNRKEISRGLWKTRKKRRLHDALQNLDYFLSLPYLVDDFEGDHDSRRDWRDEMNAHYKGAARFLESTALAINQWEIIFTIDNFKDSYRGTRKDEYKRRLQRVVDTVPNGSSEYDLLTTEQKVMRIKGLKKEIYDFLTFLSEQTVP